jgi:uncharacterized membrane protein
LVNIMQLVFLLVVLLAPGAILTLLERWSAHYTITWATKGRAGVSLFFVVTASGHFFQTAAMAEMLPPAVPFRMELIYLTGVLELLGAAGILLPGLERLAGLGLILLLLGVLPANVYAAFNHVAFGGHELGSAYLLVRVPFQLLLMWWIYIAAVDHRPALLPPRS